MIAITIKVNGKLHSLAIEEDEILADVLRQKLGLAGVKKSCGEGECGSCSVLLNGRLVNSCLIIAASVNGAAITTIEGLGAPGKLHPIQRAFIDEGAIQCGYCTPGMVLAAKAILDHNPRPDEEAIREGISGNLCRCTGYQKIVKSVQTAARYLAEDRSRGEEG